MSLEKKDKIKDDIKPIYKSEINYNYLIPKKSKIIEDEDREVKIEIKENNTKIITKPEKAILKSIDPKDFFGSNIKRAVSPHSKKVSPKNSVTPKKTNKTPQKKSPKKRSDDNSDESIKKEKSKKKTPFRDKNMSSQEYEHDESSIKKTKSKPRVKKEEMIEEMKDGGKLFL